MQKKILKAIEELDINNAYTWEGSARSYFKTDIKDTDENFQVKVHGSSEIEHDGDIDGIRDQVEELFGKSVIVDGTKFTIDTASFNYLRDDESHDSINIRGIVIIKIN